MRALLVVLMLVPAAAAGIENPDGPFQTDLYLHVDGAQDMVLSPQAPPQTFRVDHRQGIITHSSCVDTPGQGFTGAMHHTWYAYVSPLPVAYDPGMKPSPERGILADLHMDSMEVRFYVSSVAGAVVPEAVLRATVREGDDISVHHAAMDSGRLVGQAETEPAMLSPTLSGHPHVTHHEVDGRDVYGFTLSLPVTNTTIPAKESFNLRLDLFIQNDVCPDGEYLMTDSVAVHSSPGLRPGITMEIHRPVRIERLSVALADDLLQFRAAVAPVFGSADAILREDAFQVTGPTTPATVTAVNWNDASSARDGRVYAAPARHDGQLHALGSWAFDADGAASGEYTLRLEVTTQSGATATATVPFTLGAQTTTCSVLTTGEPTCAVHGQADKRTPMPWALMLVALALALRRR